MQRRKVHKPLVLWVLGDRPPGCQRDVSVMSKNSSEKMKMKYAKPLGALLGAAVCASLWTGFAAAAPLERSHDGDGQSCRDLHIPQNSDFQSSFDPPSGTLIIDYVMRGEGRQVSINARDGVCRSNASVRAVIDRAEAAAANELASVCESARQYLKYGPRNEKERTVQREDAQAVVDQHC